MQASVQSEPVRGHDAPHGVTASNVGKRNDDTGLAGRPGDPDRSDGGVVDTAKTMGTRTLVFIERHPLVAAGAALAVGAAIAMAMHARSQRRLDSRLDRQAARAMKSMDRSFRREMRSLRHSDFADNLSRFGNSLGEAFSRFDLAPLAERGRDYLEAARRRMAR
ncbi:MAG: hypothetical protein AB7O57_12060 [Hyphomicrobiaceae bacterium]